MNTALSPHMCPCFLPSILSLLLFSFFCVLSWLCVDGSFRLFFSFLSLLLGLYSSLLSSRTFLPRCWGWSPHSLAQTTPSGSSLAFRARWTEDMTCTRPTRRRSAPWRTTRWGLMDDLGQWLWCAHSGRVGSSYSFFKIHPKQNGFYCFSVIGDKLQPT